VPTSLRALSGVDMNRPGAGGALSHWSDAKEFCRFSFLLTCRVRLVLALQAEAWALTTVSGSALYGRLSMQTFVTEVVAARMPARKIMKPYRLRWRSVTRVYQVRPASHQPRRRQNRNHPGIIEMHCDNISLHLRVARTTVAEIVFLLCLT
jgi:hypothetical protein